MRSSTWACATSNGDGVAKDAEQAVSWYRRAADAGNADAQFNLGVCYSQGLRGCQGCRAGSVLVPPCSWRQGNAQSSGRFGQLSRKMLSRARLVAPTALQTVLVSPCSPTTYKLSSAPQRACVPRTPYRMPNNLDCHRHLLHPHVGGRHSHSVWPELSKSSVRFKAQGSWYCLGAKLDSRSLVSLPRFKVQE